MAVPSQFSAQQLHAFTDGFSGVISNSGAFGTVYRGTMPGPVDGNQQQIEIAVKVSKTRAQIYQQMWQAERDYLPLCRDPNIIRLIGFADDETAGHFYLVFPYYHRGTLKQNLADFQWPQVVKILCGLASGIDRIHTCSNPPIIHGDLKPDNILIDYEGNPIISDFGTASEVGRNYIWGTIGYVDPIENLTRTRVDVFAFGVIVLQMLSKSPGVISEEGDHIKHVFLNNQKPWKLIHASLLNSGCTKHKAKKTISLALQCVHEEALKRPTLTHILRELDGLKSPRRMSW